MPDALSCFAAGACFDQLHKFDRMHSTAHDLAIRPLKIPRVTARPGQAPLRHNDSPALLRHDDSTALLRHDDSPALLQHVDSPALLQHVDSPASVQGQSWPYACHPEVATEVSSGTS